MQISNSSLFISYDGMTDPLGQSQVLPYLIGLSKNGFKIFLISCEKPEVFEKGRLHIQNICIENNIEWHPIPYHRKPPVLSTLYDIYSINKKAKEIVYKNNISLLHCRSYIAALIGLGFKVKHGKKFLFDMRGFWADERVDGNIWNQSKSLYRYIFQFFKKKEIQFFENADYTISLTHNGKNEILSWKSIKTNPIPIEVIPCCADLDFFSKKNINKVLADGLKQKLSIPEGAFVLTYLGAIGTWYLTDEMLAFFKLLIIQKPNAVFQIITAENPQIVYDAAIKAGVDIKYIRVMRATRTEVVQLLSYTDFSIFFIKPAYSKKASSPTKLGELLSMGVPVICNNNVGDVQEIITKSNTGIVLNSFDENSFKDAIDKMNDYLEANIAERAKLVNDFFDLKIGVEKYTSVYKKILTKSI